MKTKNKVLITIITVFIGYTIFYYILTPAWWYFQDFTDRHYYSRVRETWDVQNRSSKFLINQLESRNGIFNGVATNILAKRKNPATIEPLIRLLQTSKNEDARHSAIGILNQFDDPRVVETFMNIVKAGRSHPDYISVLRALSIKKYEPVFKYVLEMAKIEDEDRAPAVSMLEHFEKPEAIPALQKIADSDPEEYIRNKAKKAIEHIKSLKNK